MDPFGDEPFELVAIDARGRKSSIRTPGFRLDLGRGLGIHIGLFESRIHVMARGVNTDLRRIGGRSVELTKGYLQLLAIPAPLGLTFEVRREGEITSGSQPRLLMLNKNGAARVIRHRKFVFAPKAGLDVGIDIETTKGRPRVILNALNRGGVQHPGRWHSELVLLLNMMGVNSAHILLRQVRATVLRSRA